MLVLSFLALETIIWNKNEIFEEGGKLNLFRYFILVKNYLIKLNIINRWYNLNKEKKHFASIQLFK